MAVMDRQSLDAERSGRLTYSVNRVEYYAYRGSHLLICLFVAAMPFSISATQIALGLALLLWIMRLTVLKTAQFRSLSLEWVFLAFIGAEVLSLIFSTNAPESVVFLKRILLIPIVYLVAFQVKDEKQFKLILTIFIVSLTLYSFIGILTYFTTPSVRVRHIQNSMTTGGITMIASLACFALTANLKDKNKQRLLFIFGSLNTVCLFLTSTRSSWLGFLAGILFIIFVTNKKAFIAVPCLIIGFYFLTPRSIFYHVQHFFDPTWGTNVERLAMWETGWRILQDYPLVGIGDVGTAPIFQRYAPPEFTYLIGHFHSNYVHIAVTLGIIGLVAYLFMMTKIFVALVKVRSTTEKGNRLFFSWSSAAVAIAIAFHVNGFFEWNFGDAEIVTLFWFTVGLALAVPILRDKETNHLTLAARIGMDTL